MAGTDELVQALGTAGWVALEEVEATELVEIAASLGTVEKVQGLKAREADRTSLRSLSSIHGRAAFPPHTDGAAESVPPHYVALHSDRQHRAATLLYDGRATELACSAFSSSWLVRGGASSFYAVPRRCTEAEVHWRFNPDIMRPVGDLEGREDPLARFDSIEELRIEWKPGSAVIWDNRRMLHAREAVGPEDGERALTRVSVGR